jgi:MFS transporter, FSR family, fosmidomycin resistance protein
MIPILAINYKYSLTQLSLMMTIMTVVSSFIQPYLGFIIDQKGKSKQIIYSLLWITILMSALGFFQSFYTLALIMTLASLGCSFYHPLGSLLVTKVAGSYRERAMSIFSTTGNLGYALAPIITIPVVKELGLKGLIILIVPGLLSSLWLKTSNVSKTDLNKSKVNFSYRGTFQGNISRLIQLNSIVGLRAWAMMIITSFLPLYLVKGGMTISKAGNMLTIFLVANTIGIFAGGWLAERVQRRLMFLGSLGLAALFFTIFLNSTGISQLVFLIISGFFIQLSFSTCIVMAQELVPHNAGMATGMMLGLTYGLGSLGLLVSGVIADFMGLFITVSSVVFILCLTWILSLYYFHSSQDSKLAKRPHGKLQDEVLN